MANVEVMVGFEHVDKVLPSANCCVRFRLVRTKFLGSEIPTSPPTDVSVVLLTVQRKCRYGDRARGVDNMVRVRAKLRCAGAERRSPAHDST